MNFKRTGPAPDFLKKINRLDAALVALALLCYLLLLTGDYFVPFKSPLWLGGTVFLLVAGTAYKVTSRRGLRLAAIRAWVAANWPVLALLAVLLGGGLLRYQALKTRPNTPATPPAAVVQAFATDARSIINNSDWQPKSYEQPPLYLFSGAMIVEVLFFQQGSAGKIDSPDKVVNQDILDYLAYANLLLGLATIVVVYLATTRWWQSRTAGTIAAGLVGTAWLSYQATPNPAPQLLAGFLAALAFLALTFIEGNKPAPVFWAGLLAGLATGTTYGAVLTLVPLVGLTATRAGNGRRWRQVGLGLGGWLLGWTLACPGWILGVNRFVAGLSLIKPAPDAALNIYFLQFFSYDLGLLAVVFATLGFAALRRTAWGKLWLSLSFPLLYFILLNFLGPLNATRLALIVSWLAIAAGGPFAELVALLQGRLPTRFAESAWTGAVFTLLGLAVVLMVSIVGRRFFA